jgi:predicted enzyme related to lactoylglutathione lyase
VGRFAVLSDPQGAAFAVFKPAPGGDDGVSPGGGLGDFTWHELATTDLSSALQFYSELFGWSKGATHDMGAMGIYQIISHGGQDVGGVYKAHDASVPPSWLSYARVADASKAAVAVKEGGGRVLNGPMEVPGGSWIVMLLDPQGGAFAVVEAPKQAAATKPAAPKPAAKGAPAKAPAKKTAAKTAPAKTAAKKAVTKKAAKKATKKAAKKAPAKRAAGKKSTTAKRGSGSAKAGKKTAPSRVKSKAKAKKKR